MSDDHTQHFGTYKGPGESLGATLRNGFENLLKQDSRARRAHSEQLEKALEAIEERLKAEATTGSKDERKLANAAKNLFDGIKSHLEHMREEHPGDKDKLGAIEHMINHAFADTEGKDAAALVKELQSSFKRKGIGIPGQLVHAADIGRLEELKLQVQGHWGQKGVMGKGFAIVGGTVGLGVVAHGLANVKRGLFGYHDAETGEKRSGSLSNIIVGTGEAFVGLFTLKRAMTGSWSLGRAKEGKAHHHHDHHHGHHHGHDHGHHHH